MAKTNKIVRNVVFLTVTCSRPEDGMFPFREVVNVLAKAPFSALTETGVRDRGCRLQTHGGDFRLMRVIEQPGPEMVLEFSHYQMDGIPHAGSLTEEKFFELALSPEQALTWPSQLVGLEIPGDPEHRAIFAMEVATRAPKHRAIKLYLEAMFKSLTVELDITTTKGEFEKVYNAKRIANVEVRVAKKPSPEAAMYAWNHETMPGFTPKHWGYTIQAERGESLPRQIVGWLKDVSAEDNIVMLRVGLGSEIVDLLSNRFTKQIEVRRSGKRERQADPDDVRHQLRNLLHTFMIDHGHKQASS